MPRFSYDELRSRIAAYKAAGLIWNKEFEDLKYYVSAVYEAEREAFKNDDYMSRVRVENRDNAANAVYWLFPYSAVHCKGKLKDIAKLEEQFPNDQDVTGAKALLERIAVLAGEMIELKPFIKKGRKPSDDPTKTPERTLDHTGTCAICGKNVKREADGTLYNHGFTIKNHWRQGSCFGVGYQPFELSPKMVEDYLVQIEKDIEGQTETVRRLKAGKDTLQETYTPYGRQPKMVAPTDQGYDRVQEIHVARAESFLRMMKNDRTLFSQMLAKWAPRPLPDAHLTETK